MNVKICGITSGEDARMCLEEGADAIGVIVDVPFPSRRKVTLQKAKEIRDAVNDISHAFVAVIMPRTVNDAVRVYTELRPDALQLHGNESREFMSELKERVSCRLIKAIHIDGGPLDMDYVKDMASFSDMLLMDTKVGDRFGGTGQTHNYAIDVMIRDAVNKSVILSGGLTPENVRAAVEYVEPYAVDVSSGDESKPGVKDREKVRKLIEVTSCL